MGRPFIDADDEIQRRAGKPIPDIFRDEGEASFRQLESSVIRELCSATGNVVAAGGGAFVSSENRRRMLAVGSVICLTARPETVLERLAAASSPGGNPAQDERPMLAGENTRQRITELLAQRSLSYAQAHHVVETDGLTPDEVAQRALEACMTTQDAPEGTT